MWMFREESGFWREPASLVLPFVFIVFQNIPMPFLSQTPSQGAVEPLMERKSLSKQPACSWHSNLHRAIYQKSRAIWRDEICHAVLQHQSLCSHRKNQNCVGSPALFLTFHMKLRETRSQLLERLPIWHCNPWYLSVIHKKRHLNMKSKLRVSICHAVG